MKWNDKQKIINSEIKETEKKYNCKCTCHILIDNFNWNKKAIKEHKCCKYND